jgi:hypothetical protein
VGEETRRNQTSSLTALRDSREELDEFNEFRRVDLTAIAGTHLAGEDVNADLDNEMDDDEAIFGEQERVAEKEKENEVAAEMSLPIRAASEDIRS